MALAKHSPTDDDRIRRYLQHVFERAERAKELACQILACSRHTRKEVKDT